MKLLSFLFLSFFGWHLEAAPVPKGSLCPSLDLEPKLNYQQAFSSQTYPAFPGKSLALIVFNATPELAAMGTTGQPDSSGLSIDGSHYLIFYLQDFKRSLKNVEYEDFLFPVGPGAIGGPKEKSEMFKDVFMATEKSLRTYWNLEKNYALREVEINAGKGAPSGQNKMMVAITKVAKVDPNISVIDPDFEIPRLENCVNDFVKKSSEKINTALDDLRRTEEISKPVALAPKLLRFATWDTQNKTLVVKFFYERREYQVFSPVDAAPNATDIGMRFVVNFVIDPLTGKYLKKDLSKLESFSEKTKRR